MSENETRRTLGRSLGTAPHAPVRTFLIADIRGYTRFTELFGDEASARLAAKFSDLVREGAELRGGTLVEVRGDEALVVFESARQAIRAAVDLQKQFVEETRADSDLPLRVGIGIDSGEAVALEDGSFRGAALNMAARLCAIAHGGEVVVSEGTSHLAGRLPGVRYIDRGRVHLKGIEDSVHVMLAAAEGEQQQKRPRKRLSLPAPTRLGWGVGLAVALIAATTATAVVYLTGENKGEGGAAATSTGGELGSTDATRVGVIALIPSGLARNCVKQPVQNIGAVETAVCVQRSGQAGFTPDRWEVSIYPSGSALREAYNAERGRHDLATDQGKCNRLTWGGEGAWSHGPGKPGGRRLCYFDGNDAVIVWSHERLGQPTHRDVLCVAREGGTDHASLTSWWAYAHHLIGKVQ